MNKFKLLLIAGILALNGTALLAEDNIAAKGSNFIREWEGLGNIVSFTKEPAYLNIKIAEGKNIRFTFLKDNVVRVRFNRENKYSPKDDKSYAVIKTDYSPVDYNVEEKDDRIIVTTGELKIELNKSPYKMKVMNKDGKVINEDYAKGISWNDERIVTHKKMLNGSKFYGFGEKTGNLLKNGSSMTMWNSDTYKYKRTTDPIYASIPFFVEINKEYTLGTFFDNTYQTVFDIGKYNSEEYFMGAYNGEINYYLIYGKQVKDVIKDYTELTGRMGVPPKWAMGYQQSRYSYLTQKRVLEVAKTFREKKMPADVIYLDIDFMSGNKAFTWNPIAFPDPKGMIDELHKDGFKVITIIDPGIAQEKGYDVYDSGKEEKVFVRTPYGGDVTGTVWPGVCVFPDFTNQKTKDWWGRQYKKLTDLGMDAFWNDMNEPSVFDSENKTLPLDAVHYDFGKKSSHAKIHNVYGLEMTRATFEGMEKIKPDNRNFVLSRAGYSGIQRYAALWTGDNAANWDHLSLNITMCLGMGISGIPMVGADVGGYSGSPTPELFVRWMELGSMIPLWRNHTEKDTDNQEPWEYGKDIENISRKYMEIRYSLIQYFNDLYYESYKTGVPLMRPIFMEFPADETGYTIENEFMVGDEILVAPVLQEKAVSREVYFPAGTNWYDYYNGKKYEGGKNYTVEAPLDTLPIFIKEGAVFPQNPVVQYIDEKRESPLTINVYKGKEGSHTLYLDDGISMKYKKGEYREVKIAVTNDGKATKVKLESVNKGFLPKEKYYNIKLKNTAKPVKITIDGKEIKNIESIDKAEENSWEFKGESVGIRVFDNSYDKEIVVE